MKKTKKLLASNPFAPFAAVYRAAAKKSRAMSAEELMKDWLHTKPSESGSASLRGPDTYVSPVSGHLIRI